MPTPLIATAAKVTVRGRLDNQLCENVWYTVCDTGPALVQLESIAAIFQTAYGGIATVMSDTYFVNDITVRYMGSALGPEITLTNTPPQQGGVAGAAEPNNVALCVSLRTAQAGRQARGRKYFSGIPKAEVDGNLISTDFCDAILNEMTSLILALATNGTELAIVSLVGLTVLPVVAALCVDNTVDSMRRRLPGRGR